MCSIRRMHRAQHFRADASNLLLGLGRLPVRELEAALAGQGFSIADTDQTFESLAARRRASHPPHNRAFDAEGQRVRKGFLLKHFCARSWYLSPSGPGTA